MKPADHGRIMVGVDPQRQKNLTYSSP
jgi:hypothetical protein